MLPHNYFLIIFFSFWLIVTIVNQFDSAVSQKFKKADVFNMIPKWTFFAPNPATNDLHLMFRELDNDGSVSDFKEYIVLKRKHIISTFFNPTKRAKKTLQDLVRGLSKSCISGSINERNIKVTFNYIALLNFLTQAEKKPTTKAIQFMIIRTKGFISSSEPDAILISDFHDV